MNRDVEKPPVHPRCEFDHRTRAEWLRLAYVLLLARRRRPLAEQRSMIDRKYLLQEDPHAQP